MSTLGRIVMALLVAPIVLSGTLHASDESSPCDRYSREKLPKFHLARQIRNESLHSIVLFISVATRDITQDRLLTLSCSLGKTYAKNETLVVWILDDRKAAKRYNPQGEGNDSATSLAYRASYSFSREKNDQSFGWLPDRGNYSSAVEIKLGPPPPIPHP
jgi:hypothetical protein